MQNINLFRSELIWFGYSSCRSNAKTNIFFKIDLDNGRNLYY